MMNLHPIHLILFAILLTAGCGTQEDQFDRSPSLLMAPDQYPAIDQDPRTIYVEIDHQTRTNGMVKVGGQPIQLTELPTILTEATKRHGYDLPVLIRASSSIEHRQVKAVMETITDAGIWRIEIAALKDSFNP